MKRLFPRVNQLPGVRSPKETGNWRGYFADGLSLEKALEPGSGLGTYRLPVEKSQSLDKLLHSVPIYMEQAITC